MKHEGKEELAAIPGRADELRACAELADFLGRWDRYDASGKLIEEEAVKPPRTVGELKAILDSFVREEAPERSKMVSAHLPESFTDAVFRNARYYAALRALLDTREDVESLPQFMQFLADQKNALAHRQDELESEL